MGNHTKEESIHAGHRERMREKFKTGRESMRDHEILEMLLYAAIPRINTNIQAHELIKRGGGTLSGVLELDEKIICAIPGMNKSSAAYIQLLRELNLRLTREKLTIKNERKITRANIIQKLRRNFIGCGTEKMIMITADNDAKYINTHIIATGTDNATLAPIKQIIHMALDDKANIVFLAHNHPNGVLAPSKSDIDATRAINEALKLVDVSVVEHFIITEKAYMGIMGNTEGMKKYLG